MAKVQDELAPLVSDHVLSGAPFSTISLIIRYGTKAGAPEVGVVRDGELQANVEANLAALSAKPLEELTAECRGMVMATLDAVAERYGLERPWRSGRG